MNFLRTNRVALLIGLVCILFPTYNSTNDAFAYASAVKYGEHLFLPHHLLYNPFCFAIVRMLEAIGIHADVMATMKVINALFAAASLVVLQKILEVVVSNKKLIEPLLFIAGFSFAFCRFATENENYIIPVFWSLVASLYFLKSLPYTGKRTYTYLMISGLFAAIACLFHQIHVFWWLALLVSTTLAKHKSAQESSTPAGAPSRSWHPTRALVSYFIPALLVPLCYGVVLFYQDQSLLPANFINYVLHDFVSGPQSEGIGWGRIPLGLMNFVRSFVQLHGQMLLQVRYNWLWALPAVAAIACWIAALRKSNFSIRKSNDNTYFLYTHIIIFILQFLVALVFNANAEFMVMLPVLTVIIVAMKYNFSVRSAWLAGFGLAIWNLCYGLLPNYYFNYENNQALRSFINAHPKAYFITSNFDHLQNEYGYATGEANPQLLQWPVSSQQIDSLLQSGNEIYTDYPPVFRLFTRRTIVSPGEANSIFPRYKLSHVFEYSGYWGTKRILKVEKKP